MPGAEIGVTGMFRKFKVTRGLDVPTTRKLPKEVVGQARSDHKPHNTASSACGFPMKEIYYA
jgi:hypothetical protein